MMRFRSLTGFVSETIRSKHVHPSACALRACVHLLFSYVRQPTHDASGKLTARRLVSWVVHHFVYDLASAIFVRDPGSSEIYVEAIGVVQNEGGDWGDEEGS